MSFGGFGGLQLQEVRQVTIFAVFLYDAQWLVGTTDAHDPCQIRISDGVQALCLSHHLLSGGEKKKKRKTYRLESRLKCV